jgi:hypothetical protein
MSLPCPENHGCGRKACPAKAPHRDNSLVSRNGIS